MQNLIDTRADRRSKTRSSLLFIILATIPCYCLGFVVLRSCQPVSRQPTPSPSPIQTTALPQIQSPTSTFTQPVLIITASQTPTITQTWTPTLTLTPFSTWTRTITPTVTDTSQPPTHTNTPPPTDTSIPNTPTPSSTPTSP